MERPKVIEVDRKTFLATVGAGAIAAMSHEDRAEELEHYMMHELDDSVAPAVDGEEAALLELYEQQQGPRAPRGTGTLFQPTGRQLEPMPARPTLEDFFRLRFAPATHVLQSAQHALETDQPESTTWSST